MRQTGGVTPLFLARSARSTQAAFLIEEAGGIAVIPEKPPTTVRTVLDINDPRNPRLERFIDAKYRNLGRRPYFGTF